MKRHPDRHASRISSTLRFNRRLRVRAVGRPVQHGVDLYHFLVELSWPRLALLFATAFMAYNLLFAALYMLDPGGLQELQPANTPPFWRAFFFSVHTVATIGYGNVIAVSAYANILVVIEITLGILFFALATGIAFARFSRPTARILFSQVAVVTRVDGVPTLMFRAVNERHNLIFEANVRASVLRDERTRNRSMRRFHDLALERDTNPVFALTWTVSHRLDEASPLAAWADGPPTDSVDEIVVVLAGIDDSTGQTIHGRFGYTANNVRWGERFVDVLSEGRDGVRLIDYRRFSHTEPETGDQ